MLSTIFSYGYLHPFFFFNCCIAAKFCLPSVSKANNSTGWLNKKFNSFSCWRGNVEVKQSKHKILQKVMAQETVVFLNQYFNATYHNIQYLFIKTVTPKNIPILRISWTTCLLSNVYMNNRLTTHIQGIANNVHFQHISKPAICAEQNERYRRFL